MKKILILNPYLPTLGGGEKHMGYLCKFLEEYFSNVEIDILVHNYNNIDIHSSDYPTIEELNHRFGLKLNKTKLLKVDLPKPTTHYEHFKNKSTIEKMTASYDLFINFMFFSKHIGKARKNIYSCMFPPTKYSFSKLHQKLVGKYLDTRYKNSYDFFISNSLFTNHWMQHFWNTGRKNKIIYPPVFSIVDLANRSIDQPRKDIILSVGRFFVGAHNKKQDILVDFFLDNIDKLGNSEFHLVGALSNNPIDLDYVERIRSKIQGKPVYLHLNCSFTELESLYQQAKVFWHGTGFGESDNEFPEKMEHFGITTVEAMSYGVVPVVINKGGQPEIINNGENGFVWNNEAECIERTMSLLNDDEFRNQLSMKAFERSKYFSIEKFYEKNKEIFDAL